MLHQSASALPALHDSIIKTGYIIGSKKVSIIYTFYARTEDRDRDKDTYGDTYRDTYKAHLQGIVK